MVPYGNMFFRRHVHQKEWQRSFGLLLAKRFKMASAADFGCGNGYVVEGMINGGVKAVGFDPNLKSAWKYVPESVRTFIVCRDLSEPVDVGRFECVVSIEVAEHLPPEKGMVFVANIAKAEPEVVIFTAAVPGQRGRGHINCRPMSKWISDFESVGYAADKAAADEIRNEVFTMMGTSRSHMANLMVFKRLHKGPPSAEGIRIPK
jgi:SAM-dependent methyltransferase